MTARSSGSPIEQDEPHRHLGEEFLGRQDVSLREDHLAQGVVLREPREDELLKAHGGDGPMSAGAALACNLLDACVHLSPSVGEERF